MKGKFSHRFVIATLASLALIAGNASSHLTSPVRAAEMDESAGYCSYTYWVYYRYGDGSGPWVCYGGYYDPNTALQCVNILVYDYGYQAFYR